LKSKFYYILVSLGSLAIIWLLLILLNIEVSLKYETDNPQDCISIITGYDLCLYKNIVLTLMGTLLAGIIFLFIYRKFTVVTNSKDKNS